MVIEELLELKQYEGKVKGSETKEIRKMLKMLWEWKIQKKDLKYITKWLKANVDKKDIIREFNKKYPEVDLEVLGN